MKSIKDLCLINEAEFCKPDDICYIVVDKKTNERKCNYLPYTGFGEGDELKKAALEMAKWLGDGFKVVEMKFKDLKK
jgi:hypothetical protein